MLKDDTPFIPKDLVNYQKTEIQKLRPIKASSMRDVLDRLDKEYEYSSKDYMSCILAFFFGNVSPKAALDELNCIKVPTYICGKSLGKADILWMCSDCSKLGASTCYCNECFIHDKHKGHNYSYQIGTVGCCDCGDKNLLNPETFCDAHKLPAECVSVSSLLPEYYQVYGPIIWEHIMRKLHKLLSDICYQQGQMVGSGNIQIMLTVLLLYSNIFRISPLFHHFVADALLLNFKGHITTHLCNLEDGNEDKDHDCTCSVLDNVLKYLLYLVENRQVSEFLAQLCKVQVDFGKAFLKSFWKNYAYILKLNKKRQGCFDFLDKIMWQVSVIEVNILDTLPQYAEVHITCVEQIVEQIAKSPSTIDDSNHFICLSLFFDYQYFYNKEGILTPYLINKTKFFERYIRMAGKLQYINSIVPLSTHISYENQGLNIFILKAIYYIFEIFHFTMRYYSFNNEAINAEIFCLLFEEIKNDFENKENKTMLNSVHLPLFRLLGTMLNVYIMTNPNKRPPEIIKKLSEFAKISEKEKGLKRSKK